MTHSEPIETVVDRRVFKKPDKLIFYDELNKKEEPSRRIKKEESIVEKSKMKDYEKKALIQKIKNEKELKKIKKNIDETAAISALEHTKKIFPDSLVIQLSAFKNAQKAQELLDRLQSKGFVAFVVNQGDEVSWHRVFVGPYDKRIKANETIQKLEQKGFGRGFIVDRPVQ